ncbi:Cyclin-P3-1 [Bienertia sinuspersici]
MGTFNTKTRNSELHITLGILDISSSEDASEKTPHVVSLIASVLEKNIQRNDKLFKRSRTKDGGTIFHGTKAPTLNIRQYIERIFKYSKCSPSCFVVAYIYMDKFIQATNCYLTSLNAHRLLIACVMVATKFLEDVSYNNAYFAKVGGISIAEMNKLEVKLLCSLDYRLHVTLETFDQYCLQLEKAAGNGSERRSCHIERAIQTCGLKGSWLKKDETKCNPKFAG